jgi:hypothetical protein
VGLTSIVTPRSARDDIDEGFELFSHRRGGVLKVALYRKTARHRRMLEAIGAGALDDQC